MTSEHRRNLVDTAQTHLDEPGREATRLGHIDPYEVAHLRCQVRLDQCLRISCGTGDHRTDDYAPTPAADAGVTGYDSRPLHHHHTAPRNERLQQSGTPHPGGALIELENNGQISGEQRANVGRWPLGGRS